MRGRHLLAQRDDCRVDLRDSDTDAQAPELSSRSDRSLLRRFRSGEQDAATALYVRYSRRLHALADAQTNRELAVRVDPEGIVQSVFRTFFRRAAAGEYEVPDGEELWKLFLVMALNKIRTRATHHRAAKRDVKQTRAILPTDQRIAGDEAEAFTILKLTVEELLVDLPERQQEMVLMRIEGHEVAEIAQRTNRSKRSVERLLQSFRRSLGKAISEE